MLKFLKAFMILSVILTLCVAPVNALDNLNGLTFCIDPGHGGTDPGAAGVNGLRECDVVLQLSKLVKSKLEARGAIVELTREDNSTLGLTTRTNLANSLKADRLISIHLNAFNKTSNYTLMAVYLTATATSKSTHIASFIATDIHTEIGLGYASSNFTPAISGVKKENFHMVRESAMPAVLTESSFIDNAAEEVKLRDPKYVEKVAGIIAAGVLKHYNVPVTAPVQTGDITITLQNVKTNAPVALALVKVTEKSGNAIEKSTDNSGAIIFTGLKTGDITIAIEHKDYINVSKTFTIAAGKNAVSYSIEPKKLNTLVGIISDAANSNRLINAKCTLAAAGKILQSVYSSSTGVYKFIDLSDNTYDVLAEFDGYTPVTQSAEVTGGTEKWNSIKLMLKPKDQASLSGKVLNALTNLGIANVTVNLYNGTTLIATVKTDANGLYTFSKLNAGSFKIQYKPAKPYGTKTVSNIAVAQNETKVYTDVKLTSPDMPGSINGYVYRLKSGKKVAVMNETVEIQQSGKTITTLQTGWGATAGQFRADNLKAGKYDIKVCGKTVTSTVSAAKEVNPSIKVE